MSAPTVPATAWPWPAELLAFAAKHQVQAYLQQLLEATQRQFPTAQKLDIYLTVDPEIHDDWHIVFEVSVPRLDVTNFVAAVHQWSDELDRCCPARLSHIFRLCLLLVSA